MDSSEISMSIVNSAEDRFEQGDFRGAMELIEYLISLPNSSSGHVMFSRYHVAYSVHSSVSEDRTHYETLIVSDPFCDQETLTRRYRKVSWWLDPRRNPSVAAETALQMVRSAWDVLSDPARRRAYDAEIGLATTSRKRSGFQIRDEKPEKMAKRSAVEILESLDHM